MGKKHRPAKICSYTKKKVFSVNAARATVKNADRHGIVAYYLCTACGGYHLTTKGGPQGFRGEIPPPQAFSGFYDEKKGWMEKE